MTDRRAFLTAAIAAPIVISSPAVAQTLGSKWDAAMRVHVDAQAMLAADPYNDDLSNAAVDAEDALLALPSPHLKALEWKLVAWREQSRNFSLIPKNFDVMLADIRRLQA